MDKRTSTLVTLGFATLLGLSLAGILLSSSALLWAVVALSAAGCALPLLRGGSAPASGAPASAAPAEQALQTELNTARAEADSQRQRADAAERALQEARADLGRAHAETAEAQAKVSLAAAASNELESTRQRLSEAEARLASAEAAAEQARASVPEVDSRELEAARQRAVAAEAAAQAASERASAAEAAAAQAASEMAACRAEAAADRAAVEAEVSQALARAQAAEAAADEASRRAQTAEQASAAAEQRAQAAASTAASASESTQALAAAEARASEAESAAAAASARAEAAETAAAEARSRAAAAEAAVQAAEARASAAEAALTREASPQQPLQVAGFADEEEQPLTPDLSSLTDLGDDGPDPATFTPRVLVVDDSPVSQMVAAMMLRHLGCEVDLAANGSEAVNHVQQNRYDMIFMDLDMPGMDGLATTTAIRRLEPGELPIVALCSTVDSQQLERCLQAGLNDCLGKPLQEQGFADMLQRWTPFSGAVELNDAPGVTTTLIPAAQFTALDTRILAELRQLAAASSSDLLQDIFGSYLKDSSARLQQIRAAVGSGDLTQVARLAHALKGASLTVGAVLLAPLAEQLETQARAGKIEAPDVLLQQLDKEFERVRNSVRALHEADE